MIYDQYGQPAVPATPFEGPTLRNSRPLPSDVRGKHPLSGVMARLAAENPNNPQGLPFDPGQALAPITRGGPAIAWAPWPGYNLNYDPSKKLGIPADRLRVFADRCAGIRVVLEQLKREHSGYTKNIVPTDKKKRRGGEETPEQKRLREWLDKPDGVRDLEQWENAIIEDALVVGASALWRMHNYAGEAAGIRPLDAALFAPVVTTEGLPPEPPAAAYYQAAYSLPYREYTRDEVIYHAPNSRTWTPFGMGPVEQTVGYVMLSMYRSLYYLHRYDDGSVPPGWATLPKDFFPTTDSILTFADKFNAMWAGETGKRHEIPFMPEGSEFKAIQQMPAWDYEFDEYLMRVFAWALGVAPTPIVKTSSLGKGSEGLSQEALAAGVTPLQKFFQRVVNRYIRSTDVGLTTEGDEFPLGFGVDGYQYEYVEGREENKAEKRAEMESRFDRGTFTRDELRAAYGDEPCGDEFGSVYLMKTPTGWAPVEQVLAAPEPVPPELAAGAGQPALSGGEEQAALPAGEKQPPPEVVPAEKLAKGDVEGHEFHGNQWTGGQGGSGELASTINDIAKPWEGYPPPSNEGRGTAGGMTATGETNTALGDRVEELFVRQMGMVSLLPPGQRQNPLDVRYDHSKVALEVKARSSVSKEYVVKLKAEEVKSKEEYAKAHGLTPAVCLAVVHPDGTVSAYAHEWTGSRSYTLPRDSERASASGWVHIGTAKGGRK